MQHKYCSINSKVSFFKIVSLSYNISIYFIWFFKLFLQSVTMINCKNIAFITTVLLSHLIYDRTFLMQFRFIFNKIPGLTWCQKWQINFLNKIKRFLAHFVEESATSTTIKFQLWQLWAIRNALGLTLNVLSELANQKKA